MRQSYLNLVIIAGVLTMAVGAWVMPMYNAQLAHDDALAILFDTKEVKSVIVSVQGDISNKGLQGQADMVSLLTASADESELKKVLGQEFTAFSASFLGGDTQNTFGAVEVLTFELPPSVELLPDDLNGVAVTDATLSGNCDNNGTTIGTTAGPSELVGFTVVTPADFVPGGGADNGPEDIRLLICADGDILDHTFRAAVDETIAYKGFFGFIQEGANIRAEIVDGNAGGTPAYSVWVTIEDESFFGEFQHFEGLAGGDTCDGLQITVTEPNPGTGAPESPGAGNADVFISHEFLPLSTSSTVSGAGVATFTSIPTGGYFVDVFSHDATVFPEFSFTTCDATTGGAIDDDDKITVTLQDQGTLVASKGAGGDLTINVTNATGAVVSNARIFVNPAFGGFLFLSLCDDGEDDTGNAGVSPVACPEMFQEESFTGVTITEGTASDGTITIAGLPKDTYFVSVCDAVFNCGDVQFALDTADVTVNLEVGAF